MTTPEATAPIRASQRKPNLDNFKWIVTVDSDSSFCSSPKVGRFQLSDKHLFPPGHPLIDPMPDRQKWGRGQKVSLMWPVKDSISGKTNYQLTNTHVHGLFTDAATAQIAERSLLQQLKDESLKRQKGETTMPSNGRFAAINVDSDHEEESRDPWNGETTTSSNARNILTDADNNPEAESRKRQNFGSGKPSNARNVVFESDSEQDGSSDVEEQVDEIASPPSPKRRSVIANKAAGKKINSRLASLPDNDSSNATILTFLQDISADVKAVKDDLERFKTKSDEDNVQLNERVGKIETRIKSIGKKQDANNKTTDNISRQIAGQPLATHVFISSDTLYDPVTEPVIYMGLNKTTEINDVFQQEGKVDKGFVKGLAKLFYADDMWYWMLASKADPDKQDALRATARRPLQTRDPEGVALIHRIMRRYWERYVFLRHEDYIRKSTELAAAVKSQDNNLIAMLEAELKSLQNRLFTDWHLGAIVWFNAWGNDKRNRTSVYAWQDSLFGQTVTSPGATPPRSFDSRAEAAWRKTLLGVKQGKKAEELRHRITDGETGENGEKLRDD